MSLPRICGLVAWLAALAGVLQVHQLHTSWTHVLCGPWGCGPPTEAVVAMQGFWLIGLAGLGWLAAATLTVRWLALVAWTLIALGSIAVIGLVAWDLKTYLPQTAAVHSRYLLERCLWIVATATDLPATQCLLVGGALALASNRKRAAERRSAERRSLATAPRSLPAASPASADR